MKLLLPWETAKAIFKPPSSGSKLLDRLGFWRSVLGLATVAMISFGSRPMQDVVLGEPAGKAIENAALALFAVPVTMIVVYLLTYRPYRSRLSIRRTLRQVMIVGVTVLLPIILINMYVAGRLGSVRLSDLPAAAQLVLGLLLVVLGVWWLAYTACAIYWAARTCFWVGEFHPLLGPVVSAALVSFVTIRDLLERDTKGLAMNIWLMITLCGLASTLALAVAEYRQLSSDGVGWRTGPLDHREAVRDSDPPAITK